ncbi:MAG: hypothetical protein GKR88_17520 [Flavobacteriaceae bacterium]|nr:MAG: hypothetical protein GKR88_17520 [Flavobacteriaceae bacterium]
MTLEFIAFIASVLFGILIYWRESNGNGLYRFLNKLIHSKKLQMKPEDKTGFVYQQKFILRLVFITFLFLIIILALRFLIPVSYGTVSMFVSGIVGTLIGTYIAGIVLKSSKIIDEKAADLKDMIHDTFDDTKADVTNTSETPEEKEEKSARERLKDKGLL